MAEEQKSRSWAHRIREENARLREKIKALQKENILMNRELLRIQELLTQVPGGLMLLHGENIVYANETICEWFGRDLKDLKEKPLSQFICMHGPKDEKSFLDQRTAVGYGEPDEFRFTANTGKRFRCVGRYRKIRYGARKVLAMNLIEIDRSIEEERYTSRKEKKEAFKTMLSGLSNVLLSNDVFSEQARKSLIDMGKGPYRVSEIVPVDVNKIIENCVERFLSVRKKTNMSETSVDVKVQIRARFSQVPKARGCAKDLRDVFFELLENAVDALSGEGDIYLTTEAFDGFIHIYVQENGAGIPEDELPRVFDPFFSTKGVGHHGLGLSWAQTVIERHGGEICLSPNEGGGSVCVVRLPCDNGPPEKSTTVRLRPVKDARILVIGEQNLLMTLIRSSLEARYLSVTRVEGLRETSKVLRNNHFDLLMLIPDDSTKKCLRIIQKASLKQTGTPIILIDVPKGTVETTFEKAGVDHVFARPLRMEPFIFHVLQILWDAKKRGNAKEGETSGL